MILNALKIGFHSTAFIIDQGKRPASQNNSLVPITIVLLSKGRIKNIVWNADIFEE